MEATSSLTGSQGNNGLQNQQTSWVSWHSQVDNELRSQIIRHVYTIFSQRKPEYQGHAQKISEFSKRVEEMLYKTAKSREEYARLDTVELRIKDLLKNYMMLNGPRQMTPPAAALQQTQLAATQLVEAQPQAELAGAARQQQIYQQPGIANAALGSAAVAPPPAGDGSDKATVAAQLQHLQQLQQAAMVGAQGAAPSFAAPANQPAVSPGPAATAVQIEANGNDVPGAAVPSQQQLPPPMQNGQQAQQPLDILDTTQVQQPSQVVHHVGNGAAAAAAAAPGGGSNPVAVAGAPAGNSTCDSGLRLSSSEALGTINAANVATSSLGIPNFNMSNGAPVLLRGGPVTSGQVPQAAGGLGGMLGVNGMFSGSQLTGVQMGMGGVSGNTNMMASQQAFMGAPSGNQGVLMGSAAQQHAGSAPLPALQALFGQQQAQLQQQAAASMLPTHIKVEGGGMMQLSGGTAGMIPLSGGFGAGMMPLVNSDQSSQTLAQQQQLLFNQNMANLGFPLQQSQQPQFIPVDRTGSEKEGSLAGLLNIGIGGLDAEVGTSDVANSAIRYEARKQQILKQQRWLLFLRHCAKCQVPESECQYGGNCTVAKQLWQHLINCKEPNCNYPRCTPSRELLKHHQKCTSAQCPVCAPVKQYVSKQRQLHIQRKLASVSSLTPEQKRQLLLQAQQKRMLVAQAQATGSGSGLTTALVPNSTNALAQSIAEANAPIIDTIPAKRPRVLLQENMGTSLLEYFDEKTIHTHLSLLRLEAANQPQSRSKPSNLLDGMNIDHLDESCCKVCDQNRLTFEPPSLYCFLCGQRIKRNQTYYCTSSKTEVRGHWCHPCFSQSPGDTLMLDTFTLRKAELEKKKNDDETEESWVQCDRCECWVHQICGLFNKGRNDENRGYLCPSCLLHGIQRGERKPPNERPQAWLSARDLPKCELSDYLEQRLDQILIKERQLRASALGKLPHQVPTAEGLTVRVVNNVVKKCEVKPRFLEAFGPSGYPDSFMYKQKVVLLFQQLDGVDMCLFCLYLQEYGDDVPAPNTKTVYLSYLDSVKYFQPENTEATGRSMRLRTMVYHELLSGYLTSAKQRGFTNMIIWACPPLQGDDYIMYCHPGRQKTPSSKLLREWYLVMLREAKEQGTIAHIGNLYDTYFEEGRDHWLEKPSIMNLPYLEGDYWPGEAENLLANLGEEPKAGAKGGNAKARKGVKDKRKGPNDVSTDGQLLAKLGSAIQGIREDFIVAHLYENCSQCHAYISGSNRYYHPSPPQKVVVKAERTFDGIALDKSSQDAHATRSVALTRFQLCQGCFDRERGLGGEAIKPQSLPAGIDLTDLVADFCPPIPAITDSTPEIENEFFDTRNAFLSLCQGNHFQFDTLRRARHSSMMVLYHLHNPSEPAFSCTCNICNCEIGPHDGGFRCTTCSDFDMCARCHASPTVTHPHALEPHSKDKFDETRMRLTDAERVERTKQLQRTMSLLVHASGCSGNCPSSNCAKVKALFQHAYTCKVKIGGGCAYCRRMWALLQAHAKMCTASECPVPRCKELRSLRRQQATRQEDQRRAAYRKMLQMQADAAKQQKKKVMA